MADPQTDTTLGATPTTPTLPALPPLRQDTTGMTSMQPQIPQRRPQQGQFRAGGILALVQAATQKIGERKQRETQQTFDRFTQASQGVLQAKAQMDEAVEVLKKDPSNAQARQAIMQAKQAMQQNQTILNDMFSGPHGEKHSKLLSKGFGIDDKNANTPERQAAIQAMKKSMGVGDKAAGILSQLPQTQQLSPEAQRQAMLQRTGVVGKPATGGQELSYLGGQNRIQSQQQIAQLRAQVQRGLAIDHAAIIGQRLGYKVSRGEGGEPKFEVYSPEERKQIPYLAAQDDAEKAKADYERERTNAMNNPRDPTYKINMMNAQSRQLDAEARMKAADAATTRALTAQMKEPPEVAKARIAADQLDTEFAKAQQYLATPTPTNDTALVFSYVRAQVAGAGRMTNTEIEQALKSGSFGTRLSNAYSRATKGELDPDLRKQYVDSIGIARDKARLTADKYDVKKAAEGLSDDEILKLANEPQ